MTPRLRLLLPLAVAASTAVLLVGCTHVRGTAPAEAHRPSVKGYVARKSKPEVASRRVTQRLRAPGSMAVAAAAPARIGGVQKPEPVPLSRVAEVAPARQPEPSVALSQADGGPNPLRRPSEVTRPSPVERPPLSAPAETKPTPPAKSEAVERPPASPQPAPSPVAPPPATAKPTEPATPARPTAEIRRQGVAPQSEAAATPTAPAKAPPKAAPTDGIAGAIDRANLMLRVGNVQGAREALADSVKARHAEAISELARTYDPLELQAFLVAPGTADAAKAIELYSEAVRLGSSSARVRLERLKASQTGPAPKPKN